MEEQLVIDKKPFPGLQVFDDSNCLRYFSKETILEHCSGSVSAEHYLNNLVFSMSHILEGEPEKLFYLMSICPEEEVVNICRNCWQQSEKFKISLHHVVRVFLNWGATLESLGIQCDHEIAALCTTSLLAASPSNFPAPHNVKAVLDSLTECLSDGKVIKANDQSHSLVKVLVTASLDERFRQHRFKFNQTISTALETFPVWDVDEVAKLVEHLYLLRLGLQNAAYVCCGLFTSSPRIRDFKIAAVRHLLHSRFCLSPPSEPLQSLIQNLPPTQHLVGRFQLVEIYILTQLLNTLIKTCSFSKESNPSACVNIEDLPSSMVLIERLLRWTEALHSELRSPNLMYTVEGGFVREKVERLRADCVELICSLKNGAKNEGR